MHQPTFNLTVVKETPQYGQFSFQPLEKGFGHTLGNTLRRILLSDLKGAALTKVKIEGVQHKFTTLEGVKEDVVDLTLNLKGVRISYDGDEPLIATLSVKGPKQVTAADINFPPQVTLANPNHHLATLAKDAHLNLELEIQTGYGYSPAEERSKNSLGEILLDAVFSPVQRVAYDVMQTRVGRRTDFDKLVLEIYTDGTQKPSALLEEAARIAVAYFSHIYQPVSSPQPSSSSSSSDNLPIEDLGLSKRIVNTLKKAGYNSLEDFQQASLADLKAIKNFGDKSLQKLLTVLEQHDLKLS